MELGRTQGQERGEEKGGGFWRWLLPSCVSACVYICPLIPLHSSLRLSSLGSCCSGSLSFTWGQAGGTCTELRLSGWPYNHTSAWHAAGAACTLLNLAFPGWEEWIQRASFMEAPREKKES